MTAATKRRLRMGIQYAIYALAVLLLQDTLLSRLPIAGVHLMLVPVAASCASMWLGAEKGGCLGVAMGTLWALSGAADGGILLLGLTVSCVLGGWLCDAVFQRRLTSALLACAMTLLITLTPVLLVRLYLSGGGVRHVALFLRQILLSLLLCPPAYVVGKWLGKAGDSAWTA